MTQLDEPVTQRTSLNHTVIPEPDRPVVFTRRGIDRVLIAFGVLAAVVFAVAGALLAWGSSFAADYVSDELSSQNITFPTEEALIEDGREDLVKYAGEQLDTGDDAEAYASYIDGHLVNIGGGLTYSEYGTVEREARAAVTAAQDAGAPAAEIEELQAASDDASDTRNSLFKGETLRGLLLSAFAWSTVGTIAGYAAIAAFVAAALMAALVLTGVVHYRRMSHHNA
jgi:hypothetical protein